jgi:broad specificity phosphatase PhoE
LPDAGFRFKKGEASAGSGRRGGKGTDMRIVLVRHGRPDIARTRWIGHRAFSNYIDAYQKAGLDRLSEPPPELLELVKGARRVFCSELPRSIDSARRLLPDAELLSDPLFTEAPLASPKLPGIRMNAPAWAVIARVAWHGGYKPGIESYGEAKRRARAAARTLIEAAREDGIAILVAHGYFNAILGRTLRLGGFEREGTHRVQYWNTVVYEGDEAAAAKASIPAGAPKASRIRRLRERMRRGKRAA